LAVMAHMSIAPSESAKNIVRLIKNV
jgi:hypothetical protein